MTLDSPRRYLLNLKAAIFGVAILNFMLRLMHVRKVELEIQARIGTGVWPYPAHWDAGIYMFIPFLLLGGAVCLLINRWWSLLLAILASVRVVYGLVYLPWISVHFAHDVPLLSAQAFEKLAYGVYVQQSQYLIEVILAAATCAYAVRRSYLEFMVSQE